MEIARFEYEVTAVLRLSKEEVERLSAACDRHYDSAVRALSEPGPGAILNAARNSLSFGDEDGGREFANVCVTRRQLDTLAKATELTDLASTIRCKSLMAAIDEELRRLEALR